MTTQTHFFGFREIK